MTPRIIGSVSCGALAIFAGALAAFVVGLRNPLSLFALIYVWAAFDFGKTSWEIATGRRKYRYERSCLGDMTK